MKKKWLKLRVIVTMCAAFGWWGLLYPELTLTPDTVKIYAEDGQEDLCCQSQEWSFDSGLYLELLAAGPDKITFRSKLLENIRLFLEAFHDEDGFK